MNQKLDHQMKKKYPVIHLSFPSVEKEKLPIHHEIPKFVKKPIQK